MVKKLTKFQFQSFPHPVRPDAHKCLIEEHERYVDDSECTLGILFRDRIDDDWGYVILQPDDQSVFVAIRVDSSFEDIESAREHLLAQMDYLCSDFTTSRKIRSQPTKARVVGNSDPFIPVVPRSKLNPMFGLVTNLDGFAPARGMIKEVYSTYSDRDGNFLEQLQTSGFDSRIWELYLHTYLIDSGFNLHPSVSPDFIVSKAQTTIGIEAVTANPTQGFAMDQLRESYSSTLLFPSESDALVSALDTGFEYKQNDYVPIKLGSALYSKLQRRYWESQAMRNVSLILAIETFHDAASLHYSSSALSSYLYGYRQKYLWEPEGRLLILPPKDRRSFFWGEAYTVRVLLSAGCHKHKCRAIWQQRYY